MPQGLTAWQDSLVDPYLQGLGSVHQVADPVGQLVLSQAYDPSGNLLRQSALGSQRSAYGFAGEEQDSVIGQLFLRART